MNMKKSLVVGVALTMVASLGLAGCGSNGGVEKTEDGKIKITMWHGFSEADGKTLEGIVDDFNNSQDGTSSMPSCSRGRPSARPWSPRSPRAMARTS